MKKRFVPILMVLVLVITLIPATVVHANDIRVTIDGQLVNFPDQHPVIVDGRTLVPVRGVFEALGFDVDWDDSTRTAILARHDYQLRIPIGSYTFTTNGVNHTLDVPAQIIGGRTMLPIRFPLESVGYELDWDGNTRTVIITTGRQATVTPPTPPPEPTYPVTQGDGVETFHYVYRSDVDIVGQPPAFSFIEVGDTFIITMPVANDLVRGLAVGQMFVLEPTAQNPDGLAGRVISIEQDGAGVVITARMPESLSDIFYEFEFVGDIDLLTIADEIIISDELAGLDGVEIRRNPTSYFAISLTDITVRGLEDFSGEIRMYAPRARVSMDISGVDYIILDTAAQVSINFREC